MANSNHRVRPAGTKGVDGLSILPGREIVPHINWEHLKREFLLDSQYKSPAQWLMNVMMWSAAKTRQGNVQKAVTGWSSEKAIIQQQITDASLERMLAEQQKTIPDLLEAKMELVRKVRGDVKKWDRLSPAEKKLCFEILKTELGEPKNIQGIGLVKSPKADLDELEDDQDQRAAVAIEAQKILEGELIEEETVDDPGRPPEE